MPALDRRTLADEARTVLEQHILEGGLKAGEKLNEVSLSARLGVSRGTVREAIRSLSQSGLIEVIANRGAFVRKISEADVACLYDLRRVIFGLGCELAAKAVANGQAGRLVEQLEDNLAQMRQVKSKDATQYYDLNIEFHNLLMDASKNPHAQGAYNDCVRKMHLFRRFGLANSENRAQSVREHETILAAIRAGKPEQASLAAQQHVAAGQERFISKFGNT